jgi:hypothetical protein
VSDNWSASDFATRIVVSVYEEKIKKEYNVLLGHAVCCLNRDSVSDNHKRK